MTPNATNLLVRHSYWSFHLNNSRGSRSPPPQKISQSIFGQDFEIGNPLCLHVLWEALACNLGNLRTLDPPLYECTISSLEQVIYPPDKLFSVCLFCLRSQIICTTLFTTHYLITTHHSKRNIIHGCKNKVILYCSCSRILYSWINHNCPNREIKYSQK